MTRFIATLGRHRSQVIQALVLAIGVLLALEVVGVSCAWQRIRSCS